jgi:hypothetical protein
MVVPIGNMVADLLAKGLLPIGNLFFCILFGRQECVGHSFAYVAHL